MSDIIKRADEIVGITERMREWFGPNNPSGNTHRRGAYCEWLAASKDRMTNAKLALSGFAKLEDIAAEVVRVHSEEEKAKHPDDGLPPGPWGIYVEDTPTATWLHVSLPIGSTRQQADLMKDYLTRCGSPAIRRLLAAFEVTEEKPEDSQGRLIRRLVVFSDGSFTTLMPNRDLPDGASVVCWLTPRSKP